MTFRTVSFFLSLGLGFLGVILFFSEATAQSENSREQNIAAGQNIRGNQTEVNKMTAYVTDIEERTIRNNNFREVLNTASHSQLVVMTLRPGEEIGMEVHGDIDQFLRIEAGTGKAVLDGTEYPLKDGSAVVIPAGVEHNIVNTSEEEALKLYTIYTPPEHPDGTVHATKAEADAAAHHH